MRKVSAVGVGQVERQTLWILEEDGEFYDFSAGHDSFPGLMAHR